MPEYSTAPLSDIIAAAKNSEFQHRKASDDDIARIKRVITDHGYDDSLSTFTIVLVEKDGQISEHLGDGNHRACSLEQMIVEGI